MSSTSAFISRLTRRRNSGTAKMPTTSHSTRKNAIFSTDCSIWPPSTLPPAIADSITIITMARISSRISTDITSEANCC